MTTTMVKRPEWIEKLPNGWAFLPVRAVLKERKEKNTELEESNILSVMKDVGVIRYEDKGNVGNKSSERPEAYKIVRKNDLVLNSMNLSIGSVGMAREDGVTSSVYIIYQARPKVADSNFYHYLFQTTSFQRHLASYGRGIMELREAVKERDIKNQPIVVPPLEIQKRIADFLGEKTKTIDELVAKKEKLIELLREKRAAFITRAVTKGLDHNAKLKPSGIDWLGDIPEGWKIWKLKYLAKRPIKNGIGEPAEYTEETWPRYIRITDIESPRRLRPDTFRSLPNDVAVDALVYYSDLLMAAVGGTFGRAYLHLEDAGEYCYAGYLVRFSPNKKVHPSFAGYWTESAIYWNQLHANVIQATIQNFSAAKYKELLFLLPSLETQKQIADFLDAETEKIDKAVALIESQIEKLKEYRSSLIYHTVTGKIKV